MATLPTFKHEIQCWKQNIDLIAGIDEVGMGALAGPVVAGAVILRLAETKNVKRKTQNIGVLPWQDNIIIRDSKALSAKQRGVACAWIKENSLAWAVGEASVKEIDDMNIRQASHLAMRRAVDALQATPELLLIDGTPVQLHDKIPAVNIIGGDKTSYSIAAASIIAKVYRDQIMVKLDDKFSGYGWVSNKGYGSQAHMSALNALGASEQHRKSYGPVARVVEELK